MAKKVSIIVPVYNVEKYLERCMKSLLNQTYEDVEIILIDDGSTDSSGILCDNYAEEYTNVHSFHKSNGGLSDARNYGMKRAKGDLISFVDSDDWISIHMIECLVNELEKNHADIACCEYYMSDGMNIQAKKLTGNVECMNSFDALKVLLANKKYKSHAWNKLFRAKILKEEEFPKGRNYEDVFVMHNWFRKAKRVVFVEKGLYYYFERYDSIVHLAKVKNLADYVDASKKRLNDVKAWKESAELVKLAEAGVLSALLVAYVKCPDFEKTTFKKQIFREIKAFPRFYYTYLDRKPGLYFQVLKTAKFLYRPCVGLCSNDKLVHRLGKLKEKISNVIRQNSGAVQQVNFNKSEKKIILFGVPEYNNLGDIAISYATKLFVESNYKEIQYYELTERTIKTDIRKIAKNVSRSDLILMQGGGNLNDLYADQNKIRRIVINRFKNNNIVLLPQSCFFTESKHGQRVKNNVYRIFKKHKNLILMAREPLSEEKMKEYFSNKVILVPDMVLSMPQQKFDINREFIGICLRRDVEAGICLDDYFEIIYKTRAHSCHIEFINTLSAKNIKMDERENELNNIWKQFRKCRLIITDRLHGVIFSYITRTPCIAINTNNDKIAGIVFWLKNRNDISICNNIGKLDELINEQLNCQAEENDSFEQYFSPLKDIINDWISRRELKR